MFVVASIIYGLIGLMIETIFTGFYNYRKKFKGEVSLLMFPVYASSYYFMSKFFGEFIAEQQMIAKYLLITLIIYLCEYAWGVIFDTFKVRPWNYTHKVKLFKRYVLLHVDNKINLVYLPFWFLFAIITWHYYQHADVFIAKVSNAFFN